VDETMLTNGWNRFALGFESHTIYDDGPVFYLNGVEVMRLNMPDGNVNYLTTALP
jgi:hypothetical protein